MKRMILTGTLALATGLTCPHGAGQDRQQCAGNSRRHRDSSRGRRR